MSWKTKQNKTERSIKNSKQNGKVCFHFNKEPCAVRQTYIKHALEIFRYKNRNTKYPDEIFGNQFMFHPFMFRSLD